MKPPLYPLPPRLDTAGGRASCHRASRVSPISGDTHSSCPALLTRAFNPRRDMFVPRPTTSPLTKLGRQGAMHPTGSNTPCLTPQMGIQDAAATRCTPRYAPPQRHIPSSAVESGSAQSRCVAFRITKLYPPFTTPTSSPCQLPETLVPASPCRRCVPWAHLTEDPSLRLVLPETSV